MCQRWCRVTWWGGGGVYHVSGKYVRYLMGFGYRENGSQLVVVVRVYPHQGRSHGVSVGQFVTFTYDYDYICYC